MLKPIAVVVGIIVAIAVVLAVIGMFLPKGHVASRTITLPASPEQVFAVISNIDKLMTWRSDLKSVERLPDDGKGTRFREKSSQGEIVFRIDTLEPNSKMVTRIDDPSLPFGGTWTFQLTPSGSGTSLTITEAGEVYNPLFRTMQKLFFSPYKTIDRYQADLGKLFSQN